MEKYLVIITTLLVVTQIVRLVQNTISLRGQRKALALQIDQLEDITNADIKARRMHDRFAVEWYRRELGKLMPDKEGEND